MDSRYGIHTIELFHRVSKRDFNKVFQDLKSVNSGSFYPDTTYHSDKGMTKHICTSYCNQGVVLSREKIEQHIWNYDYAGGSNIVDVYIRYLRKKVDADYSCKLIHTIRGAGYVLRQDA